MPGSDKDKKKQKLTPPKRWPGRYSIRFTLWTPNGNAIDGETDLEEKDGRTILEIAMSQSKKRRGFVV